MFAHARPASRNPGGAKGGQELEFASQGGGGSLFESELGCRPLESRQEKAGTSCFWRSVGVFKATQAALAGVALALIVPGMAFADFSNSPPVYATNTQCIATTLNQSLGGCTSNDLNLALVNQSGSVTCTAGVDPVAHLMLAAQMTTNAQTRYNVGVYIALDGLDPKIPAASSGGSTSCDVFGTPTASPYSADTFGSTQNTCGNVTQAVAQPADQYNLPHTVDVPCTPNSSGNLQLNAVAVWNQQATACTSASQITLGAPSKCKSGMFTIGVYGSLIIKKVAANGGNTAFGFTSNQAPASFSLVDGGKQVIATTNTLSTTAQTLSAAETLGSLPAGWTLGSISCVDINGADASSFVTVNPANGSVSAALTGAHPSATCTYTNVQSSSVKVTKQVTGATAGYVAGSTFPITVNCGAGHTQTLNLADGASGTLNGVPAGAACTVSEGALPATTSANYQYDTPNITITPASFNASAGNTQNVTVTNPIKRLTSSIALSKTVTGGPVGGVTASFGFTANCGTDGSFPSTPATITLTNATGGTGAISGIPAGATCTVSEVSNTAAPTNYTWSSLAPPVVGLVVNAPGPASASFTNVLTRQTGSLVLAKVVTDSVSGAAAGTVSGNFGFTVSCDTGALPNQTITVTNGANASTTVTGVPAGAACTISETGKPNAPAGYAWDPPSYDAHNGGTVPANGTLTITTTNHLSAVPPGSIVVQKSVVGGPSPAGTFLITVQCPAAGAVQAYGPIQQPVAGGGSTTFTGIPAPNNTCTVTEAGGASLPTPPTNYQWNAGNTPPAAQTGVSTNSTVTVTNTLTRLSSTIPLQKTVTGGPASGVTAIFDFSADCGTDGIHTGSVSLSAANNGAGSITGVPAGAVCTVSENPLPTPPVNYTWGALPGSVNVTTVATGVTPTTPTASFTNTLNRQSSTIIVNKSVTNGPSGFDYAAFNFTANCSASSDGSYGGSIDLPAGVTSGSTNITVPAGAHCTVSEGSPPGAPTNYVWDTAPAAVSVTTNPNTPVTAAFVNNLIRQTSSISVTKLVAGGPANASFGTFKFDISCDAGSFVNPAASITLSGGVTTGGATIGNVPAGAVCTITEETPPPAAPTNYAWQATAAPVTLTTTHLGPNNAAFTNTLARQAGTLTLTKVIAGPSAGASAVNGDFHFNVDCSPDGSYTDKIVTIAGGAQASTDITGIPAGASCAVSETGTPSAPIGYTWSPTVTYSGTPITIVGNSKVTETVTNTLVAVPTGSITVNKSVVGGPLPAAGFSVTVACPAAGQNPAYNTTQTVAGGASTVFTGIPMSGGNTCSVTENAPLPSPPANYAWDASVTPPPAQSVVLNSDHTAGSVTVTNTLKRLSSAITVNKQVTGGPASGVSATFSFTANCGGDGTFPASMTLSGATNGSTTIANVPAGAVCSVSETAPSNPPANYAWGATPAAVGVTTTQAGPNVANFTNALTRQTSSITVNKQVTGGPGTGVSATFNFTANCSASGDGSFPASITLSNATNGSTVIASVPAGAVCNISEAAPSNPPAGYAWGATPAAVGVTTTQAGPNAANFTNTLTRLSAALRVNKTVSGGPSGGVTAMFNFSVNCGADGSYNASVALSGATSGSSAVPNVPVGATCTVSEGSLPSAPANYIWGTVPAPVTVTVSATGSVASFVNILIGVTPAPPVVPAVPAPLSKTALLLFVGLGLLLSGVYFQRRSRR